MNVHRIAEPADDSLGAQAAGFFLIRVAALGKQHLLVVDGHAPAAHPVLAVARVNMVEIGQLECPSM